MRRSPTTLFAAIGLALCVAAGCSSSHEVSSQGGSSAAAEPAGDVGPRANEDHWHAAFDVYVCDAFLGPFTDAGPDIGGLHTHQDGLIHIHPWIEEFSGANATFGRFAEQIGLSVDDGSMTVPDRWDPASFYESATTLEPVGTTWSDGDACPDGPGRVALFVWPADATDATEPEVITSGMADTRFVADGQRFVVAFVPDGVVPPQPPSTPELEHPDDVE